VKLITPDHRLVPSIVCADDVIILESTSTDHLIVLESDSGYPSFWKDEEETDPEVLEWIVTLSRKVTLSCKVTRFHTKRHENFKKAR
jgi:hypothetical protein